MPPSKRSSLAPWAMPTRSTNMRRQFDKRIMTGPGLVAERNRFARMAQPSPAPSQERKQRGKASSFFRILAAVVKFFRPKRLAPWELKAIEAAKAKRERKRLRNLRWYPDQFVGA